MTATIAPNLADWTDRLWSAVVVGDERSAGQVTTDALAAGLAPETVLLDVIGAVQRRVGEEWAVNQLTVAQEHAATAINERVIAALSLSLPRPEADRGRIVVSCVDGEWHALPARLLAEVLALRGFRVDFLGAQVPAPHLIAHLHKTGADAVALSGSLATRLPAAHATIAACRTAGVPVIAGGGAFGLDGRYARLLGAQGWAADARTAAEDLLAGPLPTPPPARSTVDDLPHLADQEFTMVSRTSAQLVKAAYTGLENLLPVMRDYTDLQRQRTAEDLAHIVDFLAATLYVDDDELFSSFLAWTGEILAARGVPAWYLGPTLELLGEELREFPRATRALHHARDRLARERATTPSPDPGRPE
jgi:methanogenic corrinoid protein MtbC1